LTTETPLDRPLDRRFLIRGGAVLAGAAGVTAIGAALAPSTPSARRLTARQAKRRDRLVKSIRSR